LGLKGTNKDKGKTQENKNDRFRESNHNKGKSAVEVSTMFSTSS